jgi:hypothetical protein
LGSNFFYPSRDRKTEAVYDFGLVKLSPSRAREHLGFCCAINSKSLSDLWEFPAGGTKRNSKSALRRSLRFVRRSDVSRARETARWGREHLRF